MTTETHDVVAVGATATGAPLPWWRRSASRVAGNGGSGPAVTDETAVDRAGDDTTDDRLRGTADVRRGATEPAPPSASAAPTAPQGSERTRASITNYV